MKQESQEKNRHVMIFQIVRRLTRFFQQGFGDFLSRAGGSNKNGIPSLYQGNAIV